MIAITIATTKKAAVKLL